MSRLIKWLKRQWCKWKGHTYKPADGVYTGGIIGMLHNLNCVRCNEPFADDWNARNR